MSRIYRALEKAEEEKRQKAGEEPSLRIFEEKSAPTREPRALTFPKEKAEKIKKIEDLGLPTEEKPPILVVPTDSFASEEFRRLKTQIFHSLPNPPHSILITSTAPEEGKTTVAVNLAMAISKEVNRKVILIDGDLRKPSIRLESKENTKGLSNYLSDGTPLAEILINSQTENLGVITAGPATNEAAELIGSKRMEELLKLLGQSGENTYLLIDSPPIISTTEPTLFSKMVDGIILVVRADRMPKGSIQRAVRSIDRQKIIGIVFNQVELNPTGYYSKYYYNYYRK